MRQCTIALAFIAALAVAPVAADMLDTDSAKKLLVNRTWVQTNAAGPGDNYWVWKADGVVCIRLFDAKQATCDDTGQWTLDAGRVCYEISWWSGGHVGKSGCFRISQPSNKRYKAIRDDGVPLFQFAVLQ